MISRRKFCKLAGVGTASIGLPSVLRAKADLGPSVRVFGIGGGGIEIVDELRGQLPIERNISTYTVNWSPNTRRAVDLDFSSGFGNPLSAIDAGRIANAVEQADTVILVAGIGGKGATDLTYHFACAAKETGARVVSVLVLPFPAEWNRSYRVQKAGIDTARISDHAVFIDNSWVRDSVTPEASIGTAIDGVNTVAVSVIIDEIRARSTSIDMKL